MYFKDIGKIALGTILLMGLVVGDLSDNNQQVVAQDSTNKQFDLSMKTNSNFRANELPTRSEVAQKKLGLDMNRLENTKLVLHVKTDPTTLDYRFSVAGNGVLQVGTATFPFTVVKNENGLTSQLDKIEVDGEVFYTGNLQGILKGKTKDEVISITTSFSEDLKKQHSNVIVGFLYDDVYLSFGDDSFLTQKFFDSLAQN